MQEDSLCDEIRRAFHDSIARMNGGGAVLLSGGVDSSIVASVASKLLDLTGMTVAYDDDGHAAPDLRYARIIAERCSIKHLVRSVTLDELEDAVTNTVRIMRSFDPMEIRNSVVLYSSISALKENGFRDVMTGDGGDELFAGYDYLRRHADDERRLEGELRRLWDVMHFSSTVIGAAVGVSAKLPYLDDRFVQLAKKIPVSLKVRDDRGKRWGKWILRHCFEDEITREIAWREKMPLERGAGTSILSQHFNAPTWGKEDFGTRAKKYALRDSVKIRDGEHLHYYEVYRSIFGAPGEQEGDCEEARCPDCMGCVKENSRFCNTCGAFPIRPSTADKKERKQ